ncbi:hypothetical protein [Exiguobacterium oxidotolerans]|uniref:hypothetical protein n=1 Tax=Exiguobacterium oxidotolerans TaxID=223958 RepID=UPI000493BBE6|nr:hypothetical protein [Exiguobacterium oxidotolerans]
MPQSFRLKVCLYVCLTCFLVLLAQSVLPSVYSSTLSLLHKKTDSSCLARCGAQGDSSIVSSGDSFNVDSGAVANVESITPKKPLFRTSFDSSISAPPYILILIVLSFATLAFFYYYIKIYRPSRFQLAGFDYEHHVTVIIQPDHDVSSELIREHIQFFNFRLPKHLQRYGHETITEWFERIGFPSPVDPGYFEVRYGNTHQLKIHQFTFFKQATDDFLRKHHM